jgi:DNA processing protein
LTAPAEIAALRELIEQTHGLLAGEMVQQIEGQIDGWHRDGIRVVPEHDPDYPKNLRAATDHPPLIFMAGQLRPEDARSVAVIGSRRATAGGASLAREIAGHLVADGYTVNSGLAAGIDTAAHTEALARGGRTVAVIGTGLLHCHPAANRRLQEQIAREGAVVSQFWPDTQPRPENFRLRNAVMSALSVATVIVEASVRSGARIQARLSLTQGRPVLLTERLLSAQWARELAEQPGVHVLGSPANAPTLVNRLCAGPSVA